MMNLKLSRVVWMLMVLSLSGVSQAPAATQGNGVDLLARARVVPSGLSRVPDRVTVDALKGRERLTDGGPWELLPHATRIVFLVAQRFPEFCWADSRIVEVGAYKGNEYLLEFQPVAIRSSARHALLLGYNVSDLVHELGRGLGTVGSQVMLAPRQTELAVGAIIVVRGASVVVRRSVNGWWDEIWFMFDAAVV